MKVEALRTRSAKPKMNQTWLKVLSTGGMGMNFSHDWLYCLLSYTGEVVFKNQMRPKNLEEQVIGNIILTTERRLLYHKVEVVAYMFVS